jgi:hypothetical protein
VGHDASTDGAQVIDDHEVILDTSVGSAVHAIEDFHDRPDHDIETRLLDDLARQRGFERFAQLHGATWKTPLAFERLVRAPHEEHAGAVENDRPDAHDRARRIMSGIGHVSEP